ncbi:MAG: large conductance mechanosensitive channel protein MscL [Christensenellaceae bacterium]
MEKKENGFKRFFGEFKKFITRGNVLDMAVGVIVGGAFTAIINALSNNILKPLIDWLLAAIMGGDSLSDIYTILKPVKDAAGVLDLSQSIYIDWGAFINAIINFLLIAFVLFCIVRTINKVSEAQGKLKDEYRKEKEAMKKYRREGLTRDEAVERYRKELEEAEKAKKEEARLAEEKAAAERAEAEAKAMANTRLLEEIRDLLKQR